ncbi:hypothetical protein [Xanthobacter sediminis]|uniref:hypothetical protein n=1 Tax=Xanthobacter sediminis TaxID=3119926 RepID=UPI0037277FCA
MKQLVAQNTQWLAGILHRAGGTPRPAPGMSERELAEMIFASLEGMMALSLADPEPEASFRRRSDGFISFVTAAFA